MAPSPSAPAPTGPWTVVTLLTRRGDAARVASWVRRASGLEPVTLLKPRDTRAWIDLYLPPGRDAAPLMAAARRRAGVLATATRLFVQGDWQRRWQARFPPLRIGRLRIVCGRDAGRRARGTVQIRLDPGLSFGTGHHFTTRFCLERISELCRGRDRPKTVLDLGTGSGILAIAAVRLGVLRVTAADNDAAAVEQARENARRNRAADRIRFEVADVLRRPPGGRYDLVVANLYGRLLARAAAALAAVTRRYLVVSGLREEEGDEVAAALAAEGLEEVLRDGDGEWCGMEFRRRTVRRPVARCARPPARVST